MKDTDFSQVHDAQKAAFTNALPMVKKVAEFDGNAIPKQIKSPYLLLEVAEMSTIKGSGELVWVNAQFNAHCILPASVPRTEIECQNFAALVMKVIHRNTWGLNIQMPEEISAGPGLYDNNPKGFKSWVVSWWQTLAIGERTNAGIFSPTGVFISESPEVGQAHSDDYQELKDGFINTTAP